jgi:parallel beta helix pectate lyase-like protein
MKLCASGQKLLLGILSLLLIPVAAHADNVTVGCPGGTPGDFPSITAALAAIPNTGPNFIFVSGTCTENVLVVSRTQLTIIGNPTATIQPANPNGRLLNIFSSQNVTIDSIVFDGGFGVLVNRNSTAQLENITVQNSSNQGIRAIDSVVHIFNSVVQNNTGSGIVVSGGSFSVDSGVTITHNGNNGIGASTTHLALNGGDGTPGSENIISNNTRGGVVGANNAEVDINSDTRIINNGTFGVEILHTSTLIMSDGLISGNGKVGAHIGETSHGEFAGTTHINNNHNGGIAIVDHSDLYLDGGIDVSSNTGNGVYVNLGSLFNSVGANTVNNNTGAGVLLEAQAVAHYTAIDTITGNGGSSLECDATSLVVGDISSLGKTKCKNVQPESATMKTAP